MSLSELLKRLFSRGDKSRDDGVESDPAPEEREDVDPFDPFPEPVRLEIRDVRVVTEEYLNEARRLGFRRVRIIHGKGVGVQREIVRGVLARTPFVERFADAPESAGGWGATVVFLAQSKRENVAEE
jgi:dsDNA-specific endonuclease/ATPase MutS2